MSRLVARKRRGEPEPQPDFGSHFHLAAPRSISYVLRPHPNLCHDIVYLSSYLHDARFRRAAVRVSGDTLTIDVKRDTWELYQKTGRLKSVPSRLTIKPVSKIEWQFDGPLADSKADFTREELDMTYLYLGEACWTDSTGGEIVLANPTAAFRLRVRLSEKDFHVQLTDIGRRVGDRRRKGGRRNTAPRAARQPQTKSAEGDRA